MYGVIAIPNVFETVNDLEVGGITAVRRPEPVATQMQVDQSLGEHHLTATEHAAPALVRCELDFSQRRETMAIGTPQAGLNVLSDALEFWKIRKLCLTF